jgi:hypothetical protein
MVEDDVFSCAGGEIMDGLKDLIRDALQFEGGVEGDDGVVTEGVGGAVAVERGGGKSAGIDAVRNEPHAALGFQWMKQVEYGAAMFVFLVEVAGFPKRSKIRTNNVILIAIPPRNHPQRPRYDRSIMTPLRLR